MGVSTLLHWAKFTHGSVAFWLWALLYFTTPFLVLWTWLRNRTHDRAGDVDDLRLHPAAVWIIAAVGTLAVATGVFLYAAPTSAISVWPWPLTPLTARVLGAVFCLGLAGAAAPLDRRWTTARLPFQVAGIMVALMLVAGIREHDSLDSTNALTWLITAGFLLVFLAGAVLYYRMERAAMRQLARDRGTHRAS
jgi:hypothetical protein